jgi:hypothetical protein
MKYRMTGMYLIMTEDITVISTRLINVYSITAELNISNEQHKQIKETKSSLTDRICKPNKTELM